MRTPPNGTRWNLENSIIEIPFSYESEEKALFKRLFIEVFEKQMNSHKEQALHGSALGQWQKLSVNLGCGAIAAGAIAAQAYGDEANIINSFLLFSVVGTLIENIIKPGVSHVYSQWNQHRANEVTEACYFLRKDIFFKFCFLYKFADKFYNKFQAKFKSLASSGGEDIVMERFAKEVVDVLFNAILKYSKGSASVLEGHIEEKKVEQLVVNLLENISI